MVKRYDFESYTGGYYTDHEMAERAEGEYVKSGDYDALRAEAEGLRARISTLENALMRIRSFVAGTSSDVMGIGGEGGK